MPKGPRNRKTVRLTLYVTDEINLRVERLADAYGQNKSTIMALLVAFGLNTFETSLKTSPVTARLSGAEQAVSDALLPGMAGDVESIHGE